MNDFELETRLRQAKPGDDEIEPLDPFRASAILSRALAQDAQRRNRTLLPSLLPTWRGAIAVTACVVAAVSFGLVDWQGRDITDAPKPIPASPEAVTVVRNTPEPAAHETNTGKGVKRDAPTITAPANSAEPIAKQEARPRHHSVPRRTYRRQPTVKPATLPSTTPSTLWASHRGKPEVVPASTTSEASETTSTAPSNVEPEEGPLFVAASGMRDDDTGELHVTVTKDVPATVPGRAEAATVQTLVAAAPTPAVPQTNDFWAHAKVESGQQPELTLTALR